MNERIEKLAEQALKEALPNEQCQLLISPAVQKFAELLIRDVTETAATYRQSKTRPVGWNFTATILDQYGLKESE